MAAPEELPYTLTYKVVVEFNAVDDVAAREIAKDALASMPVEGGYIHIYEDVLSYKTKSTLRKKDRVLKL